MIMATRDGAYLMVVDADGRRCMIRITAIQFAVDGDATHDTTIIVVAGRMIVVPESLEAVLDAIDGQPR